MAEYAVDNKIDEEPAFDWWVHHVLWKKDCMIKASDQGKLQNVEKDGPFCWWCDLRRNPAGQIDKESHICR